MNQIGVTPAQLPKEPHKLKVINSLTKSNAAQINTALPLDTTECRGASYHGYPARPTKVTQIQLPEKPKGLKKAGSKITMVLGSKN